MCRTLQAIVLVLGLLLALSSVSLAPPWLLAAPAEAPAATPGPPAAGESPADATSEVLEDSAEPLVPLRGRTEREEDRVRALALYAAGRVAERKQDYPLALKRYQRAFRLDPASTAALREIVPLAFNLDRQALAVRYALLLAEREPNDPAMLRRLAMYLTEEGKTDRALALYEKALELQAAEKPTPAIFVSRLELGRLSFIAKKFDKAAEQFALVDKALDNPKEFGLDESMQKALLNKPEATYQLFGQCFLSAGRLDEARKAFERANQAKPDEALLAYNMARVELAEKQPAQAIAKLETYLAKKSASQGTGPYQALADALAQLGQADQLIGRLEKLRTGDEANVPLTYFLAERLREAGQLEKAESLYSDLIARHPSRPPIEAFQQLVAVLHQQKKDAPLLAALGEAVGRVGSLAPLGDAGAAVARDADRAKGVVEVASQQLNAKDDKLTFGARLSAALLAVQLKDFETANKFFEVAVAAEPKKAAETLVTWGLELFLANQYADAAKIFQRGIDEKVLPEDNPALYFYLAGSLEMQGRTDEALEAARKAGEIKKDSARFAGRAAWIAYHAKRYDASREMYAKLLDEFDDKYDSDENRDAMRDARLVLSNIAVVEDKYPEAEEWLEQVLDEFPEDVGALNDLGYLWADGGKHLELALQMIRTAVDSDPKNMAYRDSLGWVLFRLGRYPEAVAELKVAAGVEEPDGVILDHLGDALEKAGDVPAAIEAWDRSAAAFDKDADGEKAKAVREKIERAKKAAEQK